ncbi:MAG: 1-acyl-sn-glycerol-3-phosphate acyltransferase [Caloramator sp.]|nr:1-acyl-sn-glycerol-3-phosphate acyltransferase [Caloramator sp.]
MINSKAANIILNTPSFILKPFSKIIIDYYINKYANIEVHGIENIKKINEPVIFVCNHLSNSDGLILNKILKKFKPYFVAGVKLASNPVSRIGLEAVNIIPIHPNTPDTDALRKCIEKIKEGKSILIFPEGTRSRTGKMIEGKKGVVLIAKKTGAKIVPLGLTGTEKLMPINDKDMAREKFIHANVKVNIGAPFYLPEKDIKEDKENYNEKCLNIIMTKIAQLIPYEYRGVYSNDEMK